MDRLKYSYHAYDEYACLKLGISLWFSLLFLLRAYLVLIVSVVNQRDRMQFIDMIYQDKMWLGVSALAALPAILVLLAWTKRGVKSSKRYRWFWHWGQWLLLLSATVNLTVVSIPLLRLMADASLLLFVQWVFSVVIFAYIILSPRVKDVFLEYPENVN